MVRIGFIIEQALGHKTHGQNLEKNVDRDPSVTAVWGFPEQVTSGLGSKIPVYKSNWTVQAGLQSRKMIAQMQRQAPLDGLFFHTQVTAVLAQNWMRQIPSVVSMDATPRQYDRLGQFYEHETGPSWLEQKKYQLNVDCYRTAKHLVTWSDWAKQGLIDEYGVPPEKITTIPPGVNVTEWKRPLAPLTSDASKPVKILFVGGNLERKGGLVLLDAFQRIRQHVVATADGQTPVPEIELHLVTKDPIEPQPGVTVYHNMRPNTPELKALFHQSDIFCLPTFGDCLPMVLSEAGAAGLPAISTDVAAIPEIVHHDHTGLIVPAQERDALMSALLTLITQPELRRSFGEQAFNQIQAQYDGEQNAQRLIALLKQTINEAK